MTKDYFDYRDSLPSHLIGMTQARWGALAPSERESQRDLSHLSPQLLGLEGWRVEAVDVRGERRRFIVGHSTGWRPCHLEIKTVRSRGGNPARSTYSSVVALEKVR